jgi:hypothetical protein
MAYKKEFDIDNNSFNFASDLAFGESGEDFVKKFYHSVIQGSAEIKTDRYRNGRMVVETNQNPQNAVDEKGAQIWKLSGINVTTAQWWIYVYAIEQSMVVISVERLKKYLRLNRETFNDKTKVVFAKNSDNPAKGFLIEPRQVMDMMYNEKYDQ